MLTEEVSVFQLPAFIEMSDYAGEGGPYLDALYKVFKEDFLDNTVLCTGLPVQIRTIPKTRDREESFWHLLTEEDQDKRKFEIERCRRISWIRFLIEAMGSEHVVYWRNKRGNQSNLVISLLDFSYVVILGERTGYWLLLTAYPVFRTKRREKFKKEYEEFLASKNKG